MTAPDFRSMLERSGLMETNLRFMLAPRGSPSSMPHEERIELWNRLVKMRKNAMIYTFVAALLIVMQLSSSLAVAAAGHGGRPIVFMAVFAVILVALGVRTIWGSNAHLAWLADPAVDAPAADAPLPH